ncbi:T9SS type A sorting domain-containing protein [Bacteroidota bacterium]
MLILLIFGFSGLQAQEATTASGADALGTGGSSSYSVGQLNYITATGTNGSIIQGVQQPYEISTTSGIELIEINLDFSVYPNPTNDFLILKTGIYENENLSYQLYSMEGKLLDNHQVTGNETTIEMHGLSKSTYFLNVIDKQKIIKSFKIIKN